MLIASAEVDYFFYLPPVEKSVLISRCNKNKHLACVQCSLKGKKVNSFERIIKKVLKKQNKTNILNDFQNNQTHH